MPVLKKIEALICYMKFLSSDFVLCLYKSTIWSCMEYCYHVWAGAPSWWFELLEKLQKKRICRTVGPSFAPSHEPITTPIAHILPFSQLYRQQMSRSCGYNLELSPVTPCRKRKLTVMFVFRVSGSRGKEDMMVLSLSGFPFYLFWFWFNENWTSKSEPTVAKHFSTKVISIPVKS